MSQKKTSKRHSAVPPTVKAETKVKKATDAVASAAAPVMLETPTMAVPNVSAASVASAVAVEAVAVTPSVAVPSAACLALIAELRGSDADAARDAAATLGARREVAALEPLMEALTNRDGFFHSVVRAAAASSLAQLGDVRAVDALLSAIHDPMAETSAEAVRALATLADARAVQPLVDVVRNAEGFFLSIVRRAAVLALAQLGGEQAAVELQSVAANEFEDSVIRQEAQAAMAQIKAGK